jgi:hypothetical protein
VCEVTPTIEMSYFKFNAMMHCVDVAMGKGILVYLLVMFDCIMKILGVDNACVRNCNVPINPGTSKFLGYLDT